MKTKIVDFQRFLDTEKRSKEALRLASRHDPDLLKMLERLIKHVNREIGVAEDISLHERITILERQVKRLGAVQYRKVR